MAGKTGKGIEDRLRIREKAATDLADVPVRREEGTKISPTSSGVEGAQVVPGAEHPCVQRTVPGDPEEGEAADVP